MSNKKEKEVKQNIEPREITQELQESYLDYAMSVIVARALPDVRDGLKPVQRRILWAMWEDGVTAQAKLRKSAFVVGSCMGKYHPHGDMAIYDTLVRMAQDFSLRYPLINGQGNWGCFTKDTKVKLTDGRDLSFENLVTEHRAGKKNYTYTVNSNGLISIAEIQNPRLTKKNADIIKVVLDTNEEITCTPNHLFMLRDGTYREAVRLQPGDSLMPLYQRLSTTIDRLRRDGYCLIHQNKTGEWIPVHHLADNYNLTHQKYSKSAGRVRHHVDFNKSNNNPDNIQRMPWGDHWRIHYQQAARQHKDPDYRKKIAEGRNKFWSDQNNRERAALLLSERNRKNWQNLEYREKMRVFLSDANKEYIKRHPERRIEFSKRASQTLKRLWQNPRYQKLFNEKIVAANKKRVTNNTGRVKFLAVCRQVFERHETINAALYEELRNILYTYGHATSWQTGISKYYRGDTELLVHDITRNHKVKKVEFLNHREDVYDLTVATTHNFALAAGIFVHNSVDGDNAAAQRYTECKMAKIAEELLTDIEKETVNWQPNYDASRQEPKYLPAKLPNLLLNGAVGIAVGMATSIPPHNLNEVVDAIICLINDPKATGEDLMEFIQGPDFPTGGVIYDKKAILNAYLSGKGAVTMRGVAEVKEDTIEITEIPYQVNKAELIIKIAELVTDKRIEDIRDVRDESDKDGMSIIIELKKDANPQKVLNKLYQYTDLQKNFNLNLLALKDGLQPQVMSVMEILRHYIDHRKAMVRRRAEFDLKKAKEREHILLGLAKALSIIDKVIATIKKSEDRDDAHKNLVKNFGFSDLQATAILEMRLQTLANLERQKIEDELAEKQELIAELELLLKSPQKISKIIKEELEDLKKRYGDERKTRVVAGGLKEFSEADLIQQEDVIITLSRGGYIKRVSPSIFRTQGRGGKGLIGSEVAEEDFITHFLTASTHDNILFFTESGKVFQTKVWEIPAGTRTAKGKLVQNFLDIPMNEKISAIVVYADNSKGYLVMVTKNGIIKKTFLEDFGNVRRNGIVAIGLKKDDQLSWVQLSSGGDDIILTTLKGQSIRFKESQIRGMGRQAAGVIAIRLKNGDRVSSLNVISKAEAKAGRLLVVMNKGYGKQTLISQYKTQNRGGSGVKTAKITAKTGELVSAHYIEQEEDLFVLSAKGQIIRTKIAEIRTASRATQGVKVMNLNSGDTIIGTICY